MCRAREQRRVDPVNFLSGVPVLIEISPIFLALIAAFLFALGAQCQNQGLATLDNRLGTATTITTSAGIHLLLAPLFLNFEALFHPAVLIFVLVGLFRPALSANLAVWGMRYLGPTLSSSLSSTSPLFGLALGILWLGEALTLETAAGTIGIFAGILLLTRKGGGKAANWPLWALALPVGAALLRALGHVLSKVGLDQVAEPFIAGMIGFVVSAIITHLVSLTRRNKPKINWKLSGVYWFAAGGLCFSTAIFALNNALMRGQVIEVVPIVAASPVFTMLMTWLVFRREKLTLRIVIAVLLVVPSVAFIAVNR